MSAVLVTYAICPLSFAYSDENNRGMCDPYRRGKLTKHGWRVAYHMARSVKTRRLELPTVLPTCLYPPGYEPAKVAGVGIPSPDGGDAVRRVGKEGTQRTLIGDKNGGRGLSMGGVTSEGNNVVGVARASAGAVGRKKGEAVSEGATVVAKQKTAPRPTARQGKHDGVPKRSTKEITREKKKKELMLANESGPSKESVSKFTGENVVQKNSPTKSKPASGKLKFPPAEGKNRKKDTASRRENVTNVDAKEKKLALKKIDRSSTKTSVKKERDPARSARFLADSSKKTNKGKTSRGTQDAEIVIKKRGPTTKITTMNRQSTKTSEKKRRMEEKTTSPSVSMGKNKNKSETSEGNKDAKVVVNQGGPVTKQTGKSPTTKAKPSSKDTGTGSKVSGADVVAARGRTSGVNVGDFAEITCFEEERKEPTESVNTETQPVGVAAGETGDAAEGGATSEIKNSISLEDSDQLYKMSTEERAGYDVIFMQVHMLLGCLEDMGVHTFL